MDWAPNRLTSLIRSAESWKMMAYTSRPRNLPTLGLRCLLRKNLLQLRRRERDQIRDLTSRKSRVKRKVWFSAEHLTDLTPDLYAITMTFRISKTLNFQTPVSQEASLWTTMGYNSIKKAQTTTRWSCRSKSSQFSPSSSMRIKLTQELNPSYHPTIKLTTSRCIKTML